MTTIPQDDRRNVAQACHGEVSNHPELVEGPRLRSAILRYLRMTTIPQDDRRNVAQACHGEVSNHPEFVEGPRLRSAILRYLRMTTIPQDDRRNVAQGVMVRYRTTPSSSRGLDCVRPSFDTSG